MNTKTLQKFILGLAMFAAIMPLLVFPMSFIFPFIVPKILFFRTIVICMAVAYGGLLLSQFGAARPRSQALHVAVGLFFVSFAVSTFAGVDWYKSFWDNHERMLGFFTLAHFGLYYLVLSSVVRDRASWAWILRAFFASGTVVMLLGVYQKIDPNFLLNNGSDRVSATLGNSIYYGGFGLFLFFVALQQWFIEQHKRWKYFLLAVATLGFVGVFLSGTRGSMLGLIVGAGVGLVSVAGLGRTYPRLRRASIGLLAGGVVVLGVLFAFRTTPFVRSIPALGNLLNTTIERGSSSTRIMAWGIAVDAWKEKPVFGWGPNNYYYAFNKYYKPEFLRHGWGETWFDNAHNVMMNTLSTQGVFGILSYAGMFGAAAYMLISRARKDASQFPFAVIGLSFLSAHLVHNVFVFENPTSYLYFFTFLAYISSTEGDVRDIAHAPVPVGSFAAVAFFGALIIFATDYNPMRANKATLAYLKEVYSGRGTVEGLDRVLAIPTPHVDDVRNDVARGVDQVYLTLIGMGEQGKVPLQNMRPLAERTLVECDKNLAVHPEDIRIHLQKSQIVMSIGRAFNQPEYILQAEQYLRDALQYSPKRQQVMYMIATILFQFGKFDEGFAMMRESIAHDPVVGEGWWRMMLIYKEIGQPDKAREVLAEAQTAGAYFDNNAKNMIINIFGTSTVLTPETAQ
jgi:O-antigen ligase